LLFGLDVIRSLLASLTITALLGAGCTAADRPWPAYPVAAASLALTPSAPIETIDILPLDLELWADPMSDVDLDGAQHTAESGIMSLVLRELGLHHYKVAAQIDSFGFYDGGTALSNDDLHATLDSLARYGEIAAGAPGRLPLPYLPARLGTVTGADATLYIGGWGYIGSQTQDDADGSDSSVGLAAFFAAVAAVVVIAEVASSHDHKQSKSTSHKSSSPASHRTTGGTSYGGIGSIGRGGGTASTGGTGGGHTGIAIGHSHLHHGLHLVAGAIDAFGRAVGDTAITASSGPDWSDDPTLPHDGGESRLYLEMTLVENLTGRVLWHAHQEFPASADQADEIERATRTMLDALPGRTGLSTAAAP
jgi:hypothetical protein